jgi:hypothetical protein
MSRRASQKSDSADLLLCSHGALSPCLCLCFTRERPDRAGRLQARDFLNRIQSQDATQRALQLG